jgi:vanillate O-demethylase ferredoxin subunit
MARPIRTVATVIRDISEPLPGIKRLVLEDEDRWELPPFRPGAHIDLHLAKNLVRTYSLCNAPHERRQYVLGIKREDGGRGGSRLIHDHLAVGMPLQVSLPRGGMAIDPEHMNILIAGGIGITPFLSVIRDMEARRQTNYVLHWSSNGPPSLPDMIAPAIEAGRVHISDTTSAPFPDHRALITAYGPGARAFCCGPEPMLRAFEIATAHWPAERVHVERFAIAKPARDPNAKPFTLVLALSGKQCVVEPGDDIVTLVEDLEADIPFSCEGGICGACRTRWREGPPVHNDRVLTPAEREHEVIVCVAGCAGPRLVLEA